MKDDPSLYVRRSVANNLNDIGKDHPDLLFATAERWMKNANENRRWIIRHALRSAVKRGEPGALRVLGYSDQAKVAVRNASVSPARVRKGGMVTVGFGVASTAPQTQRLVIDLSVHYVKAGGRSKPKVFKLRAMELSARSTVAFEKKLSLKDLTTRKHHAGTHRIDVVINGRAFPLGNLICWHVKRRLSRLRKFCHHTLFMCFQFLRAGAQTNALQMRHAVLELRHIKFE